MVRVAQNNFAIEFQKLIRQNGFEGSMCADWLKFETKQKLFKEKESYFEECVLTIKTGEGIDE